VSGAAWRARHNRVLLWLIVAVSLAVGCPAFAMDFLVQGGEVIMSGLVTGSEPAELSSILGQNTVKTVVLGNSTGGNADAGDRVGEIIRQHGLATTIRGSCVSSCSRMCLGGVSRTLDGEYSRVGLHGNYNDSGSLRPEAPARLRAWIPTFAPSVDKQLMEQWINLGRNTQMMYFYNARAELCDHHLCTPISGWNELNAGLATK
jgi:hypothetical protein